MYKWVTILLLVFSYNFSWANDDEIGYEGILKELSQTRTTNSFSRSHPFDHILFHMGVNFVSSHINLKLEDGQKISGFHSGVEATFGIDLFSKKWLAEGAVRAFGDDKIEKHDIALKEFDLKLTYKNHISPVLTFFTSFGLAARYIDYQPYINPEGKFKTSETQLSPEKKEFTTPSSLLAMGVATNVGKNLSIGVELGYRKSLISETIDQDAFDATLRLDTHF